MDSKKTLPIVIIGLAVIALVLVAYYALKPAQTTQNGYTNQSNSYGQQQLPRSGADAQGSTGAPSGTAATTPPSGEPVSSKDPATLVPDGMTLDQFCEKYYTAWKNKDWQTAYDMQPVSKKSDGDVKKFGESREGYGLVSYEVGKPQISGNVGTVVVKMDLGSNNGLWAANWTFVKNDKGQWTVQSSTSSMSQTQ